MDRFPIRDKIKNVGLLIIEIIPKTNDLKLSHAGCSWIVFLMNAEP